VSRRPIVAMALRGNSLHVDEYVQLWGRIHRLADRVAIGEDDHALLGDLEVVLCDGYLGALRLDAHRRRLARQLRDLAARREQSTPEVGRLVLEQLAVGQAADDLRAGLAGLRAQFVRLGGTSL
jgi:hypothetical protein